MIGNTHFSVKYLCLGALVVVGLFFSACAPMALSGSSASTTQSVTSGYPPPGETPTPTSTVNPWPTDDSPIVTPPPDEKVAVGEIVEIPEPKDNFTYTYRMERGENKEGFGLLSIYIQNQGSEIRLGDDNGTSELESTSDRYVVWTYRAFGDDKQLPAKSGLYVYAVETGKNVLIAPGWNVGLAKVSGDWVLYTEWDSPPEGRRPSNAIQPADYTMPLFAYNIETDKTATLTQGLPVIQGRGIRAFYDVNSDRAAWIEYDVTAESYAIKLSDLNSDSTQTLKIDLKQPLFLSVSSDLVVWRDTVWRGYSFSQSAVFTIPYAPKEWENVAGFIVTAKDDSLLWSITNTPDGITRYFEAPVTVK